MAIGSMMHTFTVNLADTDRGVYEELSFRVARHPSETDAYMLTRVLAYCLEYAEGMDFGGTVSSTEEPAVLVRDLTGSILTWIEVGAPDAERLHFAGKAADRVVVYTHREPTRLIAGWEGKKIHQADALVVRSLDPEFLDAAAHVLERRNDATLTVTEGELYLDLNGSSFTTAPQEHRLA